MSLNLHLPENVILKPCITVFGVGGAGGNAVNNMINSNLEGVKFVVANTDAQALEHSLANRRIQLGEELTRGLGAGAAPTVGKAAAEEAMAEVLKDLEGSNMVFITAGMGGGTGTGAAPVIAKMAREQGILTVGVVTKPFHFEGSHRMKIAEQGLQELQKFVDTLIIIPNQNLFRIANEKTTFADAFKMADDVLHSGVRGVTDLMMMPGLINLDFADIRTVMSEMGKAMMGTGQATGEKRSLLAAEAAISNPLLDNVSMKGARGVLINITGGSDMTLFEVDEAANRIRDEVDPDANIIFGSAFNADLEGSIRVSVVATGIDMHLMQQGGGHGGHAASSGSHSGNQGTNQPQTQEQATAQKAAPIDHHVPAPAARIEPQQPQAAVPLMPPPAPVHKPAERMAPPPIPALKSSFEDDSVFVAPRPVEPKLQQTLSSQPRHNYEQVQVSNKPAPQPTQHHEEKTLEKETPRTGLGLFGRMANSILGSSHDEEEDTHQTARSEDERPSETPLAKEDALDIPAFLRRKITH